MSSITATTLLLMQQTTQFGQGGTIDLVQVWKDGGFMMWPLGFLLLVGLLISIWKFVDLQLKASRNRTLLDEVDDLIAEGRLQEALARCQESDAPAASIIQAGLKRHDEGIERAMRAVENAGVVELASLERGLVWLATISNVAPLLGFLGTVIGMIIAFQNIELAGEVEATVVAGGIKIALITTATGLAIAIPINIFHNYFVTRVDRVVINMEESTQKMIDALHAVEAGRTAA